MEVNHDKLNYELTVIIYFNAQHVVSNIHHYLGNYKSICL